MEKSRELQKSGEEKASPFFPRLTDEDEFYAAMGRLERYLQILKEWKQKARSKLRTSARDLEEELGKGRVKP